MRPQGFDDLIFLGRLIVGHHDHAPVAARVADVRQADTRVAGGALDDCAAGLQHSAPFGIQDDPLCRAIFHRTAGIHEFALSEDFTARLFADPPQAKQRGISDRVRKAVANAHR